MYNNVATLDFDLCSIALVICDIFLSPVLFRQLNNSIKKFRTLYRNHGSINTMTECTHTLAIEPRFSSNF